MNKSLLVLIFAVMFLSACGQDNTASDGGVNPDGGVPVDGGVNPDGGLPVDGGINLDGSVPADGGVNPDGGLPIDGGVNPDGGVPVDGGTNPDGGANPDGGTIADAGNPAGMIGSACVYDEECRGTDAMCLYGFCTRTCGAAGGVTNCNNPNLANNDGPFGGVYSCWPLGPGLISLCWPNGSGAGCTEGGAACPRTGETCIDDKCQYPGAGAVARANFTCLRDGDCKDGEGCATFFNLDSTNIRTDGACLWKAGRHADGDSCGVTSDPDNECASFTCQADVCAGMCMGDGDCSGSRKCAVAGYASSPFAEFSTEFVGLCQPWAGSRAACSGNAGCFMGEYCAYYQFLADSDTRVALAGSCRAIPNPPAGDVGTSCTSDALCASGSCMMNPLTGLGYCSGSCFSEADCANGTSCRSILVNALDPSTPADDLRQGFCVQTGTGAPCFINSECKVCTSNADCMPSQGITCIKKQAGDATGFCYDPFGRCLNPCRTDCTPGGANNGGCPAGSFCDTYTLRLQAINFCHLTNGPWDCVRADLPQVLGYEDGMCGDVQYPLEGGGPLVQEDLCYYYGRVTAGYQQDVFTCGQGCIEGVTTCPSIATTGAPISTTCRTVYEYGVALDGGVYGGEARSPDQCAPATAFTGAGGDK